MQELLEELSRVQASLQTLQEVAEQLKQQVDTSAAAAIQSDQLMLTQRLSRLEQSLTRQQSILQVCVCVCLYDVYVYMYTCVYL